ncbi:MAG: hypothetical protein ACFCGT_23335 [Sandaracinaceae bacterium]
MSSCSEARAPRRPSGLVPAILAAALLGGCYASGPCAPDERCNRVDDDCDGRVDEDFVDADGDYVGVENCGTCGVRCAEVFPGAAEVACEDRPDGPACVLVSCPDGFRPTGAGACAPLLPVLCLPCQADADCDLRVPGARCLPTGSGQARCGLPCMAPADCPAGFSCADGQCTPDSGWCGCSAETEDADIACLLDGAGDDRCVGIQRCGADGPGPCVPALVEACNDADDDCDGSIDEDFVDGAGRYVGPLACGGCAMPCVPPGPNATAECLVPGPVGDPICQVDCEEGFVDVDGIGANGCECERFDGEGPPPVVGGDADCDGVPDDDDEFVYVTTTGNDTNPGTLARPVRSIPVGLSLGRATGRDVLVAEGSYEGPVNLLPGVSLFGGYRADFRDRDLELFRVVVERSADPGAPPLLCENIREATRVEGITLVASDAARAGDGSTAARFDGCGSEVELTRITVFSGRGADGVGGDDSSDNLADWGLSRLADLDGVDGAPGRDGTLAGQLCTLVAGGRAGTKACRTRNVSGGSGGAGSCVETGCVNGSPCGNGGCTDFTTAGVCDFDAVLDAATPNPAPGDGRGLDPGDAGPLTYNSPTNRGTCNFCDDNPTLPRDNANGEDGGSGNDGVGGQGCTVPPTLDLATGRLAGGDGSSGQPGTDGSGGGGASAGAGYDRIGGTVGSSQAARGGSGGGGGSGGCGAPAADVGTGGGASVGLVVRVPEGEDAGPTFAEVRVVTACGGRGGDGGVGADGGRAGIGGIGGLGRVFCARAGGRGGDGGRGGAGGGGGGGCGGGSHGVVVVRRGANVNAYVAERAASLTSDEAGGPGRAGRGGFSPGVGGTDGRNGRGDEILVLP